MQNPEIRVEHLQRMVPVAEYIESCVDIPKFYACCEACPNFGTRWSCPPFSFSAAEFWSGFETLCLYGRKIYTPETWLDVYKRQSLACTTAAFIVHSSRISIRSCSYKPRYFL